MSGAVETGWIASPVLASGESSRTRFQARPGDAGWDEAFEAATDVGKNFSVVIRYADPAGHPRSFLRLDAYNDPERATRQWYVWQFHFDPSRDGIRDNPAVSSMPVD